MTNKKFFFVVLAVFILIIACTVVPLTTTVDQTQEYEPSSLMRVDIFMAPASVIPDLCGNPDAIACTVWSTDHLIVIYINKEYHSIKHALEHELNHVVYGPKHKEER